MIYCEGRKVDPVYIQPRLTVKNKRSVKQRKIQKIVGEEGNHERLQRSNRP